MLWLEPKEGNFFTHDTKSIEDCLFFDGFTDPWSNLKNEQHNARSKRLWASDEYCLNSTCAVHGALHTQSQNELT